MQHFLKTPPGTARAGVVSAELFDELLVAVHDLHTPFHAGLGREALSAFTDGLERRHGLQIGWGRCWA